MVFCSAMAIVRHGLSDLWPKIYPEWPLRRETELTDVFQQEVASEARRLSREYGYQSELILEELSWSLTCERSTRKRHFLHLPLASLAFAGHKFLCS